MRIMVTGGAGFIGTNFIYHMLKRYPAYHMTCLDLLTYAGHIENLKPIMAHPHFTFVQGDITNRDFVFDLFSGSKFDSVVNFAAESHVDRSIENPEIFLRTNILGTQVLMDAVKKYEIKRFHQISTDEVYGELPLDRPDLLFTEASPLNPSSPYSASKASADLLTMAGYRTFGIPVTLSRCTNNYGAYQYTEKLIPLTITRAIKDESIPVYGEGRNIRDWIYVSDHCGAVDRILHYGKPGQVYNIGSNSEYSNIEVVSMILKLLGKPNSLIEYVKDRPGHDLRYALQCGKIKKTLGWKPRVTFEKGLRLTVQWYLDHISWWEKIDAKQKNKVEGAKIM